jgi:hypothetical protein
VIAARSAANWLAAPLLILAWSWARRTSGRFASLAARFRAGRLAAPAARPPCSRPPRPDRRRLPQGFGWLVRLVPEAASSASQLQHLLGEAEMAALLAAAPQAGRLLRPLCRHLGVRLPPGLRAPPRAPKAAPQAAITPKAAASRLAVAFGGSTEAPAPAGAASPAPRWPVGVSRAPRPNMRRGAWASLCPR